MKVQMSGTVLLTNQSIFLMEQHLVLDASPDKAILAEYDIPVLDHPAYSLTQTWVNDF